MLTAPVSEPPHYQVDITRKVLHKILEEGLRILKKLGIRCIIRSLTTDKGWFSSLKTEDPQHTHLHKWERLLLEQTLKIWNKYLEPKARRAALGRTSHATSHCLCCHEKESVKTRTQFDRSSLREGTKQLCDVRVRVCVCAYE